MKFELFNAAILLALPLAAQACQLKVQWVTNWSEAALRRYQATLITNIRNDDHLGLYCNGLRGAPVSNIQHNEAASQFKRSTGCEVILDI